MKKGIILNLRRFKVFNYVTLNKIFIIICVIFIVGIAVGSTVMADNKWLFGKSEVFLCDYISLHISKNFLIKLTYCLFRYLIVLLFYFLSGTSMFGVSITPFVTLWQGIFFGNVTSYLYSQYGLSGIAFNAIIIIPPSVIFSVCCFFAAKFSIDYSLSVARMALPRSKPASLYLCFKNYCIKFLILVGISLFCSLLEIALNVLFLKFFSF